MRVFILSLLAALALSFSGQGQSLDDVIKVGNESFDTKDYYNASDSEINVCLGHQQIHDIYTFSYHHIKRYMDY